MKKQIVSIITCVILAVCFVAPVSAANVLPQVSGSQSIGDVSMYWTIDFRGYQYIDSNFPSTVYLNQNNTAIYSHSRFYCELPMYNFSLTIRNRGTTIAVADLNDFQFYAPSGLSYINNLGFLVYDEINCNVYNVDWNDSSNNLYLNFRSTESLILEPDEQIVLSFNLGLFEFSSSVSNNSTGMANIGNYLLKPAGSGGSSGIITISAFRLASYPSTFSTYTVSEYASSHEGFWPFLLRYIESINARLYQDEDDYNAVEDDAIDVGNSAGDVNYGLETVGEQEHQWYEDNSLAISQTGLSNFQYSQDQVSGISHVVGQWQQVWSALGSWAVVYQFVLMLSLATFILRHRPTTKMQQRQKQRDAINEFNWDIRYARDRYWQNRAKWSEQQLARSSPDSSGNGSLTALALKRRRGQ